MMVDFLGNGWVFPPQLDGRGSVALAGGEKKIEQAIEIILSTPIGQRVMRPTFGSRLHELVFAPPNASALGLAEMYTQDALKFWEPRIEVLEVNATIDSHHPEAIHVTIYYRVKATHDERSLVFPLYRIPGE